VRRILFLAQAEVLHIVRDRILVAQILVVPIVQLLILSNAATFQIRNTSIHVVDLDRTTTSRGLASHLAASGHFQIVGTAPSLVTSRRQAQPTSGEGRGPLASRRRNWITSSGGSCRSAAMHAT